MLLLKTSKTLRTNVIGLLISILIKVGLWNKYTEPYLRGLGKLYSIFLRLYLVFNIVLVFYAIGYYGPIESIKMLWEFTYNLFNSIEHFYSETSKSLINKIRELMDKYSGNTGKDSGIASPTGPSKPLPDGGGAPPANPTGPTRTLPLPVNPLEPWKYTEAPYIPPYRDPAPEFSWGNMSRLRQSFDAINNWYDYILSSLFSPTPLKRGLWPLYKIILAIVAVHFICTHQPFRVGAVEQVATYANNLIINSTLTLKG